MGTPEFAVASLDAIVGSLHLVVAVVTVPDKPAGRGKKIQISPVKNYAMEHDLKILQPNKLRDMDFQNELKSLNADVFVVVAFRMLPREIWSMPPMGTFNLHGSLLPNYRGAAPINWAVINGENYTGVTTFFIDEKIDTGAIIDYDKIPIQPEDTAGDLHDKMMPIGANLVIKTLDKIANGTIQTKPQSQIIADLSKIKNAPKIFKEDCKIDWNKPAVEIHNFIRGLSPYPAAYTVIQLNEQKAMQMKIFKTTILIESDPMLNAGDFLTDYKSFLKVKCSDGLLTLDSVQLEGKKKLPIQEFLMGFRQLEKGVFI